MFTPPYIMISNSSLSQELISFIIYHNMLKTHVNKHHHNIYKMTFIRYRYITNHLYRYDIIPKIPLQLSATKPCNIGSKCLFLYRVNETVSYTFIFPCVTENYIKKHFIFPCVTELQSLSNSMCLQYIAQKYVKVHMSIVWVYIEKSLSGNPK